MAYVPKACGFVVVREGDPGWEYLLLESRKWAESGFPKGHVNDGESEIATARRETEEEAGLTNLEPLPGFRQIIRYPVTRKGRPHDKRSVYFLARTTGEDVRLSDEHTDFGWYPLPEARSKVPHGSLRQVLREAALYLKDRALFDLEPVAQAEADAWLVGLPEAHEVLLGHLRGSARLGRAFGEALAGAGVGIHVEATAVGALLHDTGRALGDHGNHPRTGLFHLRTTRFAPYAYACISHFTKGASEDELLAVGLPADRVAEFFAQIDGTTFTWEEQCVALADGCMCRNKPVTPAARFADLRRRYGPSALIDLQERRTAVIRETLGGRIGEDPLVAVGLAS